MEINWKKVLFYFWIIFSFIWVLSNGLDLLPYLSSRFTEIPDEKKIVESIEMAWEYKDKIMPPEKKTFYEEALKRALIQKITLMPRKEENWGIEFKGGPFYVIRKISHKELVLFSRDMKYDFKEKSKRFLKFDLPIASAIILVPPLLSFVLGLFGFWAVGRFRKNT